MKKQTKVYDHAEPVHAWSKISVLKLGPLGILTLAKAMLLLTLAY